MDAICSGFADTIKTKPKASDVPTEVQRNEDCLKSVFRAVVSCVAGYHLCMQLTFLACSCS